MPKTILRTPEMWDKYEKAPKRDECFLCLEVRNEGLKHWGFCPNQYPYDAVADSHVMLALKRHSSKPSSAEWLEILKYMDELQADAFQWNSIKTQSVKGHFHLHLLDWKLYET